MHRRRRKRRVTETEASAIDRLHHSMALALEKCLAAGADCKTIRVCLGEACGCIGTDCEKPFPINV